PLKFQYGFKFLQLFLPFPCRKKRFVGSTLCFPTQLLICRVVILWSTLSSVGTLFTILFSNGVHKYPQEGKILFVNDSPILSGDIRRTEGCLGLYYCLGKRIFGYKELFLGEGVLFSVIGKKSRKSTAFGEERKGYWKKSFRFRRAELIRK
ncbi:hypothetical protein QUH73_14045, partial [Labilibaculum sp. K2S]|uniref:hypothetical protein n=1 Tax=Labilibaculum sp. K2S TaxID=3056386 RepID=UPI0025A48730